LKFVPQFSGKYSMLLHVQDKVTESFMCDIYYFLVRYRMLLHYYCVTMNMQQCSLSIIHQQMH